MLKWESMGERERIWSLFQADPEWQQARARDRGKWAVSHPRA